MRRLNVRSAQIDACIQHAMFAVNTRPCNPELEPGELLLLQLVSSEAARLGKLDRRIEYALVFDRLEEDADGSLSRRFWPAENRTWRWIIYGSAIVPTAPFSLENLRLSDPASYAGQTNPRYVQPQDEAIILPYILFEQARGADKTPRGR